MDTTNRLDGNYNKRLAFRSLNAKTVPSSEQQEFLTADKIN